MNTVKRLTTMNARTSTFFRVVLRSRGVGGLTRLCAQSCEISLRVLCLLASLIKLSGKFPGRFPEAYMSQTDIHMFSWAVFVKTRYSPALLAGLILVRPHGLRSPIR